MSALALIFLNWLIVQDSAYTFYEFLTHPSTFFRFEKKISNNNQDYEVIIDVIMKLMRALSLFFIVILNFYSAHSQGVELAKETFTAPNGAVFPNHWGQPPLRQTKDLKPLPGGYGQGSGTLARWIQKNLDTDARDPTKNNPKKKKISELKKEIEELKFFLSRAKFTPQGLASYKTKLKKKEKQLNDLLGSEKSTIPNFKDWVKDGKKIPEGLIFTGGSPWFNERTGKNRSPEEVYRMLYKKNPKK